MSDFSADFMEYLKIYNPTAYDKVNSEGVKPEELTSIYNANVAQFEIWESIPATIRNRYIGQPVPQDIMDAAARGEIYTLREMEYHPEIKQISEAREKAAEDYGAPLPKDIVSEGAAGLFIAALAAGYAVETCHKLAINRQYRESLLAEKPDDLSSESGREWLKKWLATREKDIATIKKEIEERHPGKALMHTLFKYNRGKLSPKEMEEFPQKVEDLVQRLEASPEKMSRFLKHLKMPHMQAAIGHFKEDTLNILKHTVLRGLEVDEKEQYLARDFARRRARLLNLPDADKAKIVSDNINQNAANLPGEQTLTAKERFVNMPSALNKGREM